MMSLDKRAVQQEVDSNLDFFRGQLPTLLDKHRDKYALLRQREIAGIYDTVTDAQTAGRKLYPDGLFSIQKITNEPLNLGFFSNAMHLG